MYALFELGKTNSAKGEGSMNLICSGLLSSAAVRIAFDLTMLLLQAGAFCLGERERERERWVWGKGWGDFMENRVTALFVGLYVHPVLHVLQID